MWRYGAKGTHHKNELFPALATARMAGLSCWIALLCISYVSTRILADVQPGPFQARISCGLGKDVESNNVEWERDFGYSGGKTGSIPASQENVLFPELTSLRYFQQSDGENNCYNISAPNGHYFFRFYFAYQGAEPQFEVSLESTIIYELKAGWSKLTGFANLVNFEYADSLVYVGDGGATACFHSSGHGNPSVATFEVLQVRDQSYSWSTNDLVLKTVKRVSCGSQNTAPKFNYSADPWGGNRYWSSDTSINGEGNIGTLSTNNTIQYVDMEPFYFPLGLFQSARVTTVAGRPLSYTYPLSPRQGSQTMYYICLHFAEIDPAITQAGQRKFNVTVNGIPLFEFVDIVGIVEAPYTALFLNTTTTVEGSTLTLTFTPEESSTVLVNGFEIYEVIATEFTTRKEEAWALQSLKSSLKLPARLGWTGDPCNPYPWDGIGCDFQEPDAWFINSLDLDSRDISGTISSDIGQLSSLISLNLSHNKISGIIPSSLGSIETLTELDLSYNLLSGSIPSSLGNLSKLQDLYLNKNRLSGEVPSSLGAGPIRGASFNFSDNPKLCGPGFSPCSRGMSTRAKAGVFVATIFAAFTLVGCVFCYCKRRQNIARSRRLMLTYDAPYAKSRISKSRLPDIQLSRTSPEEFQFHSMYSNAPPRHAR